MYTEQGGDDQQSCTLDDLLDSDSDKTFVIKGGTKELFAVVLSSPREVTLRPRKHREVWPVFNVTKQELCLIPIKTMVFPVRTKTTYSFLT